METFKALQVCKSEDKQFSRAIVERSIDDLPAGELLIRVAYSSLNYKDALSATGNPGVTRQFPHTPGIDAAGEVLECSDGSFAVGSKVIVTGFDLGMETDGGFAQLVRVPSAWALPVPDGLTTRTSMMYGTAGLTAGLSLLALEERGINPSMGEVLVTGATGGVGSIALALLARGGYSVVAATGKSDQADYLNGLGATRVVSRDDVVAGNERPLLKPCWAAVIDCVGGEMLAAAIKATRYGGSVTCCGLVASPELALNVFPFILRGVSLLGIDSVECPLERRRQVWANLATQWRVPLLEDMCTEIGLDGLEDAITAMLAGKLSRRMLVNPG